MSFKCIVGAHRANLHTSQTHNKTVQFKLSDIGEGITEVTVKEWFVKVGDEVSQFDNICEVQSDKASVTITSRYDGIIKKLYYEVDDTALVGKPLIDVEADGAASESDSDSDSDGDASNGAAKTRGDNTQQAQQQYKVLATPAVRRIAAEHKVDLSQVKGTGKSGRVMKEDMLSFISGTSHVSQGATPVSSGVAKSQTNQTRPLSGATAYLDSDRTEPISGYAKTMVKTMNAANAIPHLVYSDEIDVGPLINLRAQVKSRAEKLNIKLTYMPFLLKAVSLALREYPVLNSTVDEACTHLTYRARHNIGVAMDTSSGLVVPNVKDVHLMRLLDVAKELNGLMERGASGALAPKDVTGGTITLSNIGAIGGTYMKPVLLVPEVAIGAFGRFQKLPRFNSKGDIQEANIMCVSWAADHRVVDGATIARFSNLFKDFVENPTQLLLE